MPIAHTCPHCGKELSIAEQEAGHRGPFAECGKPITIPFPGEMPAQSIPAASRRGGRSVLIDSLVFIGVLVIVILIVLQFVSVRV